MCFTIHYSHLKRSETAINDATVNIRLGPAAKTDAGQREDIKKCGREALRPTEVMFSMTPKLEQATEMKKWKTDKWNVSTFNQKEEKIG